jgi:heme A synthase
MAGPVCSGFPLCEGLTFSQLDFAHAFSWFTPLGSQTSLGLFTITSLHRLGALVVMCYVGGLSLWGLVQTSHRTLRVLFALLLLVLMLQMGLGFMNISPSRAHFIATLHHAMAAFLLLIAITVNVVIAGSRQESVS